MSARRTGIRLSLTFAACALLAACAVAPPKTPPQPATVIARPAPPPTTVTPLARAPAQGEPWTSLVASFALRDCADAPPIRSAETMYTRSPAHFEQRLRQALPLMMYVQKQLQAAGIPGEFAMLPMLESSYAPHLRSRHGSPAGMWQFMPRTAHLHGVVVNRGYDGRLDPVASTRAAIRMLTALGQQFGDWRLADMAYNAGPNAVAAALRRHPGLGDTAIPDIPVSATSRTHLARLMALSCILREPGRFHVALPKPSAGDELAAVRVPAGTRFAAAADMAEIPESKLRALNPGYLGTSIPAASPRTLLLPADAAESLAAALVVDASESVAQVSAPEQSTGLTSNIPLPDEPTPLQDDADDAAPPPAHPRRHRVREGETLWSIAHHYHVSVGDLEHWNHLHGDALRPGEVLRVHG